MADQAELGELAELLQVPAAELAFLENIDPADLQFLLTQIQQTIQQDQAPIWANLGRAAQLLPDRLGARIAESMLGAQAAANMTYHIPPRKAIGIAKHFSLPFLAEVTGSLLPERIPLLLNTFPVDKTVRLALYMLEQKDYAQMGRFLDHLQPDRVTLILKRIQSEEDVLRIIMATRHPNRLADILFSLPENRLLKLARAATRLNHWPELLLLAAGFAPAHLQRLAGLTGRLAPAEKTAIRQAILDQQLTDPLKPILDRLGK